MFGYVRAVTSVLSPEDAQRYEAVYCGLCRTLGNRYGKTAQLILNYDFVFLALLLAKPVSAPAAWRMRAKVSAGWSKEGVLATSSWCSSSKQVWTVWSKAGRRAAAVR